MANASYLTFNVKQNFFDRAAVISRLEKGKRKALSKAGAFVRKRARSILRRRKKPSEPGTPPSVHSPGDMNLRKILFAYEAKRDSVIVGPVKFNQANAGTGIQLRLPVPQIHEEGGGVNIREWRMVPASNKVKWLQDPRYVGKYASLRKATTQWRRADSRWKGTARKRKWTLADFGIEWRYRQAKYDPRPFMQPALKLEKNNIAKFFEGVIK